VPRQIVIRRAAQAVCLNGLRLYAQPSGQWVG
jgi:hypothetical protein